MTFGEENTHEEPKVVKEKRWLIMIQLAVHFCKLFAYSEFFQQLWSNIDFPMREGDDDIQTDWTDTIGQTRLDRHAAAVVRRTNRNVDVK